MRPPFRPIRFRRALAIVGIAAVTVVAAAWACRSALTPQGYARYAVTLDGAWFDVPPESQVHFPPTLRSSLSIVGAVCSGELAEVPFAVAPWLVRIDLNGITVVEESREAPSAVERERCEHVFRAVWIDNRLDDAAVIVVPINSLRTQFLAVPRRVGWLEPDLEQTREFEVLSIDCVTLGIVHLPQGVAGITGARDESVSSSASEPMEISYMIREDEPTCGK